MDIKIGKHGWIQVGGDVSPGTYGGTIATCDGSHVEIRQIQPTREYVSDGEAGEIGFPFWSKDAWYDLADLQLDARDVQSALDCCGLELSALEDMTPEQRAMAIAECLMSYGSRCDEGPAGWARDVVPGKVKWWMSKRPRGWRFLEGEDQEFRQMLRDR